MTDAEVKVTELEAEALSPQDQWSQINYPSFMKATINQVQKIENQLSNISCIADKISFSLNNVPITYSVTANKQWVTINIGTDAGGKPQVTVYIPYQWLYG